MKTKKEESRGAEKKERGERGGEGKWKREGEMMQYSDKVCQSLRQARIFSDSEGNIITSIDMTPDGSQLVATSEDEALRVYDCGDTGELKKTLHAKKYGVGIVRYMHEPSTVVCASSNEWDHSLRYWSLHENRYLRYMKGHRAKVVGLEVSPSQDLVLSASVDATVRLWDVRSDTCSGLLNLQHKTTRPAVSFDDQGIIFVSLIDGGKMALYDLRSFDQGPFATFKFDNMPSSVPAGEITKVQNVKFSSDGKFILLSGGSEYVFIIGSFHGTVLQVCKCSQQNIVNDACLTPDRQFVIGGTVSGAMVCWPVIVDPEPTDRDPDPNFKTQTVFKEIVSHANVHAGEVKCVMASPKTMLVATACRNVNLWLPDLKY